LAVGSGLLFSVAAASAAASAKPSLPRDALWHLVHDLCLGDLRLTGNPLPCAAVSAEHGYAVVRVGPGHLLLVPTVPLVGIEAPSLVLPEATDYWGYAWNARRLLTDRIGRAIPESSVGLAVNSAQARTQDQLHIHIACLSPETRRALSALTPNRPGWMRHAVRIKGSWYNVNYVISADPAGIHPFRTLSEGLGISAREMSNQTLVLAAAPSQNGQRGFYLVNRAGTDSDPATGEHLLDRFCD
jgi:CDP-diacylglycerol pyrophosphatase